MCKSEVSNTKEKKRRFASAWDCCFKLRRELAKLPNRKPWEECENDKDPKTSDETTFTASKLLFGRATENKEEHARLANECKHIVFTTCQVPARPAEVRMMTNANGNACGEKQKHGLKSTLKR